MASPLLLFLFAVLFPSSALCLGGEDIITKYPLLMPNIKVQSDEAYVCTPVKLDSTKTKYIVGFEPNATATRVHHIIVYGCKTSDSDLPVWNCGHQEKIVGLEKRGVCGSGDQVIFAWARDAPSLDLPEGVGFEVGGDSSIQYLVLQVHYAKKLPDDVRDSSGVILHYTTQQVPKQASVLTLTAVGSVQPNTTSYWETACRLSENKTIHPFAYRTHTHGLGVSVSGYRVRQHSNGTDVWTLLGRRDPQLPQLFSPVNDFGPIVDGDRVAAQCTMTNFRDQVVNYGRLNSDEMCIFYLMYWVEGISPLKSKYCNRNWWDKYSWVKSKDFNNIPAPHAD